MQTGFPFLKISVSSAAPTAHHSRQVNSIPALFYCPTQHLRPFGYFSYFSDPAPLPDIPEHNGTALRIIFKTAKITYYDNQQIGKEIALFNYLCNSAHSPVRLPDMYFVPADAPETDDG